MQNEQITLQIYRSCQYEEAKITSGRQQVLFRDVRVLVQPAKSTWLIKRLNLSLSSSIKIVCAYINDSVYVVNTTVTELMVKIEKKIQNWTDHKNH